MAHRARPTFVDLTQSNLRTLDCAKDLFETTLDDTWPNVASRFTDSRVAEFYGHLQGLWSVASLEMIMPDRDTDSFRVTYIADHPGTRRKLEDIVKVGLYADEILVLDPFPNPDEVLRVGPASFGYDLFHRISFLSQLRPLVDSGMVCFAPDPGDIVPSIKAKDVTTSNDHQPNSDAAEFREWLNVVESYLEEHPDIARQCVELQSAIKNFKQSEWERMDAFLVELLGPRPWYDDGDNGGPNTEADVTVHYLKGDVEIPTLRYVTEACASIPYAVDSRLSRYSGEEEKTVPLDPYATALSQIELPCLRGVTPKDIVRLKAKGRFGALRNELREVFKEAKDAKLDDMPKLTAVFQDRLQAKINAAKAEWHAIDRDLLTWAGSTGAAGVGTLVTAGMSLTASSVAFVCAAAVSLVGSSMKRREFWLKNPLAPLVHLELRAKK